MEWVHSRVPPLIPARKRTPFWYTRLLGLSQRCLRPGTNDRRKTSRCHRGGKEKGKSHSQVPQSSRSTRTLVASPVESLKVHLDRHEKESTRGIKRAYPLWYGETPRELLLVFCRKIKLVREAGVEPARVFTHWILSPARLPFRHSRRAKKIIEPSHFVRQLKSNENLTREGLSDFSWHTCRCRPVQGGLQGMMDVPGQKPQHQSSPT